MGRDEGIEFTLPTIPYFYHDIVARIIPGMIQLGLITYLCIYHSAEWVQKLNLKILLDTSQFAVAVILIASAYFIGVFFEGWMLIGNIMVRGHILRLYHFAFSSALKSTRRNFNVAGNMDINEVAILTEETSSILESYEPLAPHFFARATRFLAEAKMMLYSALAMPTAIIVVGITTGHWQPPGGDAGIARGIVLFLLFVAAAFARQRRRAVEILRCVQYLALRPEPAEVGQRARTTWTRIVRNL
ncbi:MAG: hypothetical protein HZA77_07205 [Candidatus Schekmanbacteria bacterium]|nr:hypothetical protein [Candidatus Schekmanbacteria bacterium]